MHDLQSPGSAKTYGAVLDDDMGRFDGWRTTPAELGMILVVFAIVAVLVVLATQAACRWARRVRRLRSGRRS